MDHLPTPPTESSYAPELRRRAEQLAGLAASIERSLVMSLTDDLDESTWNTQRARLCHAMLARNLHQLHRAADDLRITAMRFRERADELEAAFRNVA